MALIYNTTEEEQVVKVFGHFHRLKPGQIKSFQENVAHFMSTDRKEWGLVALPEEFEDLSHRDSAEGKAELARRRKEGLEAYLNRHRRVIYNNQVSLRSDLEKSNQKVDPSILASDGELDSMRLVAKYQKASDDDSQKRADEVKKLVTSISKG